MARAALFALATMALLALANAQGSGDTTTTTPVPTTSTTTWPGPWYDVYVYQRLYGIQGTGWILNGNRYLEFWTMTDFNMPSNYYSNYDLNVAHWSFSYTFNATTNVNRTDVFIVWRIQWLPGRPAAYEWIDQFNNVQNWVYNGIPAVVERVDMALISRPTLRNSDMPLCNNTAYQWGVYPTASPCPRVNGWDPRRCKANGFNGKYCCEYTAYYCETILRIFKNDPACDRLVHNRNYFLQCEMPMFLEANGRNIWRQWDVTYFVDASLFNQLYTNLTSWQKNFTNHIANTWGLDDALIFIMAVFNNNSIITDYNYFQIYQSGSSGSSASGMSVAPIILIAVGAVILVAVVSFSVGKRLRRRDEHVDDAKAAVEPVQPEQANETTA